MATTYELIKGETLASSAASYTFSAIPSTWTDLVLKCSLRGDFADIRASATFYMNSSGTTSFSYREIEANGSSVSSGNNSNGDVIYVRANGTTSTSNTFTNTEIYIPNYASTTMKKPFSVTTALENNSTTAYIWPIAGLYNSTSAITSLTINYGNNLLAGSSFYLYGVKNA